MRASTNIEIAPVRMLLAKSPDPLRRLPRRGAMGVQAGWGGSTAAIAARNG